MEMKVILRFKISGECLDSGKTASNNEKIGGAVSMYTILLISFFNSTKHTKFKKCVTENVTNGNESNFKI